MKIFSFPYVVIYELMKQFEPPGLIGLSLCSKKTHAFVKTFSTTRDVNVQLSSDYDRYFVSYPGDFLMFAMSNEVSYRLVDKPNLKTAHGLSYGSDYSGNLLTCWSDVVKGCRESTNYVCDILKVPVSTVYMYCESDLWMLDFVQQRQEQRLKNVYALDFRTSAEYYSRVLSCNATKLLKVKPVPPRDYRFDGQLPAAKTLIIECGFWISREQLLYLESSNTQLSCTKLSRSDIRGLLRVWLNGGLPNLRYLEIQGRTYDNRICGAFNDRLEPVQREISYKWDDIEPAVNFDTRAFHLRREDNVVATIMAHERSFVMAVWPDVDGNRV